MKAIIHTDYGSPDVLRLAEVEKPRPGSDEVLVKIVATAVNRADAHLLSGMLRFSSGLLQPRQQILGSDIAGRVEAVGANVTRFRPGDDVFGDLSAHGRGGFAEYVAAPKDVLVLKPANVTFAGAAAIPMTAVTALQGLRDKGGIQPGQQVLINGASGGVGTFAVQIAKAFGAEVTAVCSTPKMEMVRAIGADHVIDYTQEDYAQSGQRYDLIFDTVGSQSLADYRRTLKPGGTYVASIFSLGALLLGPWIALTEGKKMSSMLARPNRSDLAVVKELVEMGEVAPVVDRCYPLSKVPEALRYLSTGHAAGKVVVTVNALPEQSPRV